MKRTSPADQAIRAFIAVELPKNVCAWLHGIQEQLKPYRFKATWTRPENIHLTLKFLGDIGREKIGPCIRVIEQAAQGCRPFALRPQAVGFFPGVRQPRVMWMGVLGQTQALAELQRRIDNGLAALEFPREKKPFTGHLTLCRIKGGGNPELFIDIMKKFQNMSTDAFMVDSVNLYQSTLMPSGPIYSKLFTAKLGSV